jgi:hypothetical protein
VGHIVLSGSSGARNVDAFFLCLGGPSVDPYKSTEGKRRVKVVLLHSVGSADDIVLSGASGAQNIDTTFFKLMWA